MENFNQFPFNTTEPCSDFQNESSFLQNQRRCGQMSYLYAPHASVISQTLQTSPDSGNAGGMSPFRSTIWLKSLTSSGPIEVSPHSIESIQTPQYDEYKNLRAKIARANRKMARQIRAIKKTSSCGSSNKLIKTTYTRNNVSSDQDHRIVYTRDNVKLNTVLRKMLTCSDVGDQGRILLPKREAEDYLPDLSSKEGVEISMREVYSNTEWRMKYRFWANQKSKMYLFDHCCDFVRKNLLRSGDYLELYQDEQENLYFTIQKKEKQAAESSNVQESIQNNHIFITSKTTEEEELSLRVLMEELKHKERVKLTHSPIYKKW